MSSSSSERGSLVGERIVVGMAELLRAKVCNLKSEAPAMKTLMEI